MVSTQPVYLGLVGSLASGKSVVTDYLQKQYHFIEFSLSPLIHEEMKRRGITNYTRLDLQNVGNQLRAQFGADVLAKRAVDSVKEKRLTKVIFTGIRNTAEVTYLQSFPQFILISINAPRKRRFERLIGRTKVWDPKDWSAFVKTDKRDLGIGQNSLGQQVGKCMKLATFRLYNNKKAEDLYPAIEKIMKRVFRQE